MIFLIKKKVVKTIGFLCALLLSTSISAIDIETVKQMLPGFNHVPGFGKASQISIAYHNTFDGKPVPFSAMIADYDTAQPTPYSKFTNILKQNNPTTSNAVANMETEGLFSAVETIDHAIEDYNGQPIYQYVVSVRGQALMDASGTNVIVKPSGLIPTLPPGSDPNLEPSNIILNEYGTTKWGLNDDEGANNQGSLVHKLSRFASRNRVFAKSSKILHTTDGSSWNESSADSNKWFDYAPYTPQTLFLSGIPFIYKSDILTNVGNGRYKVSDGFKVNTAIKAAAPNKETYFNNEYIYVNPNKQKATSEIAARWNKGQIVTDDAFAFPLITGGYKVLDVASYGDGIICLTNNGIFRAEMVLPDDLKSTIVVSSPNAIPMTNYSLYTDIKAAGTKDKIYLACMRKSTIVDVAILTPQEGGDSYTATTVTIPMYCSSMSVDSAGHIAVVDSHFHEVWWANIDNIISNPTALNFMLLPQIKNETSLSALRAEKDLETLKIKLNDLSGQAEELRAGILTLRDKSEAEAAALEARLVQVTQEMQITIALTTELLESMGDRVIADLKNMKLENDKLVAAVAADKQRMQETMTALTAKFGAVGVDLKTDPESFEKNMQNITEAISKYMDIAEGTKAELGNIESIVNGYDGELEALKNAMIAEGASAETLSVINTQTSDVSTKLQSVLAAKEFLLNKEKDKAKSAKDKIQASLNELLSTQAEMSGIQGTIQSGQAESATLEESITAMIEATRVTLERKDKAINDLEAANDVLRNKIADIKQKQISAASDITLSNDLQTLLTTLASSEGVASTQLDSLKSSLSTMNTDLETALGAAGLEGELKTAITSMLEKTTAKLTAVIEKQQSTINDLQSERNNAFMQLNDLIKNSDPNADISAADTLQKKITLFSNSITKQLNTLDQTVKDKEAIIAAKTQELATKQSMLDNIGANAEELNALLATAATSSEPGKVLSGTTMDRLKVVLKMKDDLIADKQSTIDTQQAQISAFELVETNVRGQIDAIFKAQTENVGTLTAEEQTIANNPNTKLTDLVPLLTKLVDAKNKVIRDLQAILQSLTGEKATADELAAKLQASIAQKETDLQKLSATQTKMQNLLAQHADEALLGDKLSGEIYGGGTYADGFKSKAETIEDQLAELLNYRKQQILDIKEYYEEERTRDALELADLQTKFQIEQDKASGLATVSAAQQSAIETYLAKIAETEVALAAKNSQVTNITNEHNLVKQQMQDEVDKLKTVNAQRDAQIKNLDKLIADQNIALAEKDALIEKRTALAQDYALSLQKEQTKTLKLTDDLNKERAKLASTQMELEAQQKIVANLESQLRERSAAFDTLQKLMEETLAQKAITDAAYEARIKDLERLNEMQKMRIVELESQQEVLLNQVDVLSNIIDQNVVVEELPANWESLDNAGMHNLLTQKDPLVAGSVSSTDREGMIAALRKIETNFKSIKTMLQDSNEAADISSTIWFGQNFISALEINAAPELNVDVKDRCQKLVNIHKILVSLNSTAAFADQPAKTWKENYNLLGAENIAKIKEFIAGIETIITNAENSSADTGKQLLEFRKITSTNILTQLKSPAIVSSVEAWKNASEAWYASANPAPAGAAKHKHLTGEIYTTLIATAEQQQLDIVKFKINEIFKAKEAALKAQKNASSAKISGLETEVANTKTKLETAIKEGAATISEITAKFESLKQQRINELKAKDEMVKQIAAEDQALIQLIQSGGKASLTMIRKRTSNATQVKNLNFFQSRISELDAQFAELKRVSGVLQADGTTRIGNPAMLNAIEKERQRLEMNFEYSNYVLPLAKTFTEAGSEVVQYYRKFDIQNTDTTNLYTEMGTEELGVEENIVLGWIDNKRGIARYLDIASLQEDGTVSWSSDNRFDDTAKIISVNRGDNLVSFEAEAKGQRYILSLVESSTPGSFSDDFLKQRYLVDLKTKFKVKLSEQYPEANLEDLLKQNPIPSEEELLKVSPYPTIKELRTKYPYPSTNYEVKFLPLDPANITEKQKFYTEGLESPAYGEAIIIRSYSSTPESNMEGYITAKPNPATSVENPLPDIVAYSPWISADFHSQPGLRETVLNVVRIEPESATDESILLTHIKAIASLDNTKIINADKGFSQYDAALETTINTVIAKLPDVYNNPYKFEDLALTICEVVQHRRETGTLTPKDFIQLKNAGKQVAKYIFRQGSVTNLPRTSAGSRMLLGDMDKEGNPIEGGSIGLINAATPTAVVKLENGDYACLSHNGNFIGVNSTTKTVGLVQTSPFHGNSNLVLALDAASGNYRLLTHPSQGEFKLAIKSGALTIVPTSETTGITDLFTLSGNSNELKISIGGGAISVIAGEKGTAGTLTYTIGAEATTSFTAVVNKAGSYRSKLIDMAGQSQTPTLGNISELTAKELNRDKTIANQTITDLTAYLKAMVTTDDQRNEFRPLIQNLASAILNSELSKVVERGMIDGMVNSMALFDISEATYFMVRDKDNLILRGGDAYQTGETVVVNGVSQNRIYYDYSFVKNLDFARSTVFRLVPNPSKYGTYLIISYLPELSDPSYMKVTNVQGSPIDGNIIFDNNEGATQSNLNLTVVTGSTASSFEKDKKTLSTDQTEWFQIAGAKDSSGRYSVQISPAMSTGGGLLVSKADEQFNAKLQAKINAKKEKLKELQSSSNTDLAAVNAKTTEINNTKAELETLKSKTIPEIESRLKIKRSTGENTTTIDDELKAANNKIIEMQASITKLETDRISAQTASAEPKIAMDILKSEIRDLEGTENAEGKLEGGLLQNIKKLQSLQDATAVTQFAAATKLSIEPISEEKVRMLMSDVDHLPATLYEIMEKLTDKDDLTAEQKTTMAQAILADFQSATTDAGLGGKITIKPFLVQRNIKTIKSDPEKETLSMADAIKFIRDDLTFNSRTKEGINFNQETLNALSQLEALFIIPQPFAINDKNIQRIQNPGGIDIASALNTHQKNPKKVREVIEPLLSFIKGSQIEFIGEESTSIEVKDFSTYQVRQDLPDDKKGALIYKLQGILASKVITEQIVLDLITKLVIKLNPNYATGRATAKTYAELSIPARLTLVRNMILPDALDGKYRWEELDGSFITQSEADFTTANEILKTLTDAELNLEEKATEYKARRTQLQNQLDKIQAVKSVPKTTGRRRRKLRLYGNLKNLNLSLSAISSGGSSRTRTTNTGGVVTSE